MKPAGKETRPRIAFYAPMKPPDHNVPSGDRTLARLFLKALGMAGFDCTIASRFRSWAREPEMQGRLRAEGLAEAERLCSEYERMDERQRPAAWFTYHLFYKAPDWIGPRVAQRLRIPYLVAEASYNPRRAQEKWHQGTEDAGHAIRSASRHFVLKSRDVPALESLIGSKRIVRLAPFIESGERRPKPQMNTGGPVELLTVAMMRPGDKLDSYRFLARALACLPTEVWRLTVAGDGPARTDIEQAFAGFPPGQIRFVGKQSPDDLAALYGRSDVFAWPGIGEGIGLVYLEAMAAALPVAALDTHGAADCVNGGINGFLTPADETAYAAALRRLIEDRALARRMGEAAAERMRQNHSLETAAAVLKQTIGDVLAEQAP